MTKVLVTGATGFLGRHLVKHLQNIGYEIFISNTQFGNLMNIENLYVFNPIKFDYIFHLAVDTKAGDYCLYHKGEQFEKNQILNTNMLKYWKDKQPQAKMIAMGTSCSYAPNLPLEEKNYLVGVPESNLFTYAMTKRMLLVGLQAYAHQYGLKYMYCVPSTLYGPLFNLDDSHFIFDLIKKIYAGKHHGTPVELWGNGHQTRELVHVEDAIKILMIAANHMENTIINIGSGQDYSIRHFANLVSDIIGYDSSNIQYDTSKYVGVQSKKLSTDKLKYHFPDFEFKDLKMGLTETIKYYNLKQGTNG